MTQQALGARPSRSGFVDVPDTQLRELGAEAVEVQAQLALSKALARLLFLGDSFIPETGDLGSRVPRHDDDAIDVGDDDITRLESAPRRRRPER